MMPTMDCLNKMTPEEDAWMKTNFIRFAREYGKGGGRKILKETTTWKERIDAITDDVAKKQCMWTEEARSRIKNQLIDDLFENFPDAKEYWPAEGHECDEWWTE